MAKTQRAAGWPLSVAWGQRLPGWPRGTMMLLGWLADSTVDTAANAQPVVETGHETVYWFVLS